MESKFTGGLLGLIGINLLQFLLMFITLTLALPLAVCLKKRWIAKHTIIDGQQLVFDGTGLQLFGNYIKWILLTIITLGIYSFWLILKCMNGQFSTLMCIRRGYEIYLTLSKKYKVDSKCDMLIIYEKKRVYIVNYPFYIPKK